MKQDVSAFHTSSGIAQVYSELREELLRFLTARLGDAAAAEDAMQDLWLRLHKSQIGPVGNPRAYLYRSAQNVALDAVRTRSRRLSRDSEWAATVSGGLIEPSDASPNAEATILAREETASLVSAIATLPERAGRAFRLHKLEGLSHTQVAARLGISRSGVEKHIATAMAHLRRAMED